MLFHTPADTLAHRRLWLQTAGALLLLTTRAHAHEASAHGKQAPVKKEQRPWGIASDAKSVRRTIDIRMTDNMRFSPDRISLRQGDTVRFVVHNDGKQLHEFVIGTKQELDEHAALMLKFPGMEHDEPYMAHVEPGKRGQIIWHFNRAGTFDFACLIAGHYSAGMVGTIVVAAR